MISITTPLRCSIILGFDWLGISINWSLWISVNRWNWICVQSCGGSSWSPISIISVVSIVINSPIRIPIISVVPIIVIIIVVVIMWVPIWIIVVPIVIAPIIICGAMVPTIPPVPPVPIIPSIPWVEVIP